MRVARILKGEEPELDLIPEQRVIAGEELQDFATEPVNSGVTNVSQNNRVVAKQGHRQGSSHALVRRLPLRRIEYGPVGSKYALLNRPQRWMLGRVRSELGNLSLEAAHNDLCGHVACGLARAGAAPNPRAGRHPHVWVWPVNFSH